MSMQVQSAIYSPDEAAAVLLVSPYREDHFRIGEILGDSHWDWHSSESCGNALRQLKANQLTVLICERDQRDGCWQDLLRATTDLAAPPRLIVCSRWADEHLWAEVLNLGGYDVLAKPFDREEVLRVAFGAWHSWRNHCGRAATFTGAR